MVNECDTGVEEFVNKNYCECMTNSPLFSVLTKDEAALVLTNKTTIKFRKGEIIRKQGTQLTHVVSLDTGLVKVYLEGNDNQNTIIRIVKPTNFIGGPGIYFDQLHHYSISAITESTICLIDVTIFKSLIESNKNFAQLFLKDFSRNILAVYNRLAYLTQKQMPGRMADTLFYLFNEVFESNVFPLEITKQDIADLSGMSKDSAIKILREFHKEEIIRMSDHQIELVEPNILKRISKTG